MIPFVLSLVLASLLEAQPAVSGAGGEGNDRGSIRGAVLSATGEPLRKAEVMLRAAGPRASGGPRSAATRPGSAEAAGPWAHTTDATGAFVFDNLPPGTYSLAVQRNGYVRTEYGGRGSSRSAGPAITLRQGQDITGITIKLTPQGVITGKVSDEDGDPAAFTSVQILRERWIQGKRQMAPMNAGSTNDLGEYRIAGLMPGRYHVMVNQNRPDAYRPRPAGAESDLSYGSLYYPGTFELSQATPVVLTPGQELRGIDFRLLKVPTYRVRGKILDPSGAAAEQVAVMAMPSEGGVPGAMRMGTVRRGAFEIAGLQPGTYTLIANGGGRGQSRAYARQVLQVGARDADGVLLAMQPTFEISGTVRIPEGMTLSSARVFVDPLETGMPFGGGGSGVVEGVSWKIQGVGPGRFRFFLNPVPEGMYVKSVSAQGQDITAGAMISAAASGIEITLAAGAPELTGTVVNKDNEPASGATVVLVPEGTRQEQFWLFRNATADQNGAFALKNITPGLYTAYAFADVEDGAWFSADFLKQHDGRGVKVRLEEKARETTALTLAQ